MKNKYGIEDADLKQLYSLLEYADKWLKKNKIQYFLDSGTLLGSVRHQEIIPWDDDIDISILQKDEAKLQKAFPNQIKISIWNNFAKYFEERVDLLLKNAAIGLILVFFLLALFLEIKLAFWVMLGIPASFLGSFLLLPFFDISINMISLFAYIVVLGMVVDDAIVIGENIYRFRKQGETPINAAILGAKQMAMPITFAILTSSVAYFVLGLVLIDNSTAYLYTFSGTGIF